MAKKATKTPEAKKAEKVIQGDDRGKDVREQTMEARGIDPNEKASVDAGDAGSAASKPPLTDEMKARDAQIEEREKFLKSQGLDPDTERNSPGDGGLRKVEAADTSKKQYRGMVTVTGVHGQTHEKISARIDLPTASGEEFVHYAFFQHHPAADRDLSTITIDPENKDDPNLRSRFE
jgi:hypothetical protein